MSTRAEEIAGEGPYRVEWSGENRTARVLGPDFVGQWQTEPRAVHRCADMNAAYKQGQQELCARMEAICKRRYRDGDTVYFRTFGMNDEEDGQFLVRINRMFLHKAPTLMAALESAMKEWEESGDPNSQLQPLPSPPNPEQR